ncbi:hypothetical protein SDC9_158225 [bioreactor metagenome]|uniref:Uncharacterized protein n=1 Tax=bioreactor metagenome TaxID=1076179 RepID=A0A645F982_9ZZZZ
MTKKRVLAAVVAILFVLTFVLSFSYIAVEATHHCDGVNCHKCQTIRASFQIIEACVKLPAAVNPVLFAFAAFCILPAFRRIEFRARTLVSLRVKLSN